MREGQRMGSANPTCSAVRLGDLHTPAWAAAWIGFLASATGAGSDPLGAINRRARADGPFGARVGAQRSERMMGRVTTSNVTGRSRRWRSANATSSAAAWGIGSTERTVTTTRSLPCCA